MPQPGTMYRQGDVLIEEVEQLPEDIKPVARENGMVVLAHGEATGHHHSFSAGSAALLETPTGERFLTLRRRATLKHQEHDPIALPPGDYRVRRQREYSPEAIHNVAD